MLTTCGGLLVFLSPNPDNDQTKGLSYPPAAR